MMGNEGCEVDRLDSYFLFVIIYSRESVDEWMDIQLMVDWKCEASNTLFVICMYVEERRTGRFSPSPGFSPLTLHRVGVPANIDRV